VVATPAEASRLHALLFNSGGARFAFTALVLVLVRPALSDIARTERTLAEPCR